MDAADAGFCRLPTGDGYGLGLTGMPVSTT